MERTKDSITSILEALRTLAIHATCLTGSKQAGKALVAEAIKKHPRKTSADGKLDLVPVLNEITQSARKRRCVCTVACEASGFGRDYCRLSFDARACISLRHNFDLPFCSIGKILRIAPNEAQRLFEVAMDRLARSGSLPAMINPAAT